MPCVLSPRGLVLRRPALLLSLLVALLPASVLAGAFSVMPMRLDLGGAIRSAALTVRNEDTQPLSFSVRLRAWTQNDEGRDHYEDSSELVYFPRLLTLEPGAQAVVRVGLRQALAAPEQAFRLFVEELATAQPATTTGPNLRVAVRFGVPVFVRAMPAARSLRVEGFTASRGQARWTLRNDGNQHERFERLSLRGLDTEGVELFSQDVPARYLLAGRQQGFSVALPLARCERLARLDLRLETEQGSRQEPASLDAPACP